VENAKHGRKRGVLFSAIGSMALTNMAAMIRQK
jgi:hypothetical protein